MLTEQLIERLVGEMRERFPDAAVAKDAARTLVRLPALALPPGCEPEVTDVLVALAPGAAPELFIRQIPRRPGGVVPRSTGTTVIAGESWCTFSFNLQWDPNRHSAEQFVQGRLRRFALNE